MDFSKATDYELVKELARREMNVRLMATLTPTRMNVSMMARSRLRSTLMMVKIAPVMLNLLLTKQV